jgi:hypothetical protein
MSHYKETGKITLIGFNFIGQNFQTIELCGKRTTDCSPSLHLLIGNIPGRQCGIVAFNCPDMVMLFQKSLALTQCNRVGIHFFYFVQ